jgi:Holliday junction DNA helicase RuvA
MIESLNGIITSWTPTHIVIQASGIGFGMNVTLKTSEKLQPCKDVVTIYTYLHITQNGMDFFGFSDVREKEFFLKLISVDGVGPKMAIKILSWADIEQVAGHITKGEVQELTKIKGVGRKSAEMLALQLKDDVLDFTGKEIEKPLFNKTTLIDNAVKSLVALGVKSVNAKEAVQKAVKIDTTDVGSLVKEALKFV